MTKNLELTMDDFENLFTRENTPLVQHAKKQSTGQKYHLNTRDISNFLVGLDDDMKEIVKEAINSAVQLGTYTYDGLVRTVDTLLVEKMLAMQQHPPKAEEQIAKQAAKAHGLRAINKNTTTPQATPRILKLPPEPKVPYIIRTPLTPQELALAAPIRYHTETTTQNSDNPLVSLFAMLSSAAILGYAAINAPIYLNRTRTMPTIADMLPSTTTTSTEPITSKPKIEYSPITFKTRTGISAPHIEQIISQYKKGLSTQKTAEEELPNYQLTVQTLHNSLEKRNISLSNSEFAFVVAHRFGLIKQESGFKKVRSNKGACGENQVLPSTAYLFIKRDNPHYNALSAPQKKKLLKQLDHRLMTDTRFNYNMGAEIWAEGFAEWHKYTKGDTIRATILTDAGYNAGPDAARAYLSEKAPEGAESVHKYTSAISIHTIPYFNAIKSKAFEFKTSS
jgi:hypothetical protein